MYYVTRSDLNAGVESAADIIWETHTNTSPGGQFSFFIVLEGMLQWLLISAELQNVQWDRFITNWQRYNRFTTACTTELKMSVGLI